MAKSKETKTTPKKEQAAVEPEKELVGVEAPAVEAEADLPTIGTEEEQTPAAEKNLPAVDTYTTTRPIKEDGDTYEAGETILLTAGRAKSLGRAVTTL